MTKTNAQRQKEYRERNRSNATYKEKNKQRAKKNRNKVKTASAKRKEREQTLRRVNRFNDRKKIKTAETINCTDLPLPEESPFSTQSAETRAVNR
jgi:hypothetical protein